VYAWPLHSPPTASRERSARVGVGASLPLSRSLGCGLRGGGGACRAAGAPPTGGTHCESLERRPPRRSNTTACQWHAVTGRHPRSTRACSFKIQAMIDSWNDLATAGTPEQSRVSQLEGGRDFVDEPPINSKFFFTYIVHAVGYRPHTALTCLPGTSMHPHRMDDRGSAKHLWATTGVSTHRQEHGTRQLPLWRVVDSSRCLRLASAPPWERLPPLIH
jgi:hypothetical protein